MESLRLIPRNGTEEILLAVLRELEGLHADMMDAFVSVQSTPQPVEVNAPKPKPAAVAPKPAIKEPAAKRPVKKKPK